ncbi:MAG: hypothetical protein RL160_1769 [Bacteroidota bacterium]|jgi:hypothetical protein
MKGLAYISAGMAVFLAGCFFLLIHSCSPEQTSQDGSANEMHAQPLPDPAQLGSILYEDLVDPLFEAAGISSGYQLKASGIPQVLQHDAASAWLASVKSEKKCASLDRTFGPALNRERNRFDSLVYPSVAALIKRNNNWMDSAELWYRPLVREYQKGKINQETLGSRLRHLNEQVRDSMRNDVNRQRLASLIRKHYESYLLGVKQLLSDQDWQDWVQCGLRGNNP